MKTVGADEPYKDASAQSVHGRAGGLRLKNWLDSRATVERGDTSEEVGTLARRHGQLRPRGSSEPALDLGGTASAQNVRAGGDVRVINAQTYIQESNTFKTGHGRIEPHELPPKVDALVGRETQIQQMRSILCSKAETAPDRARLVAVSGMAGVGKSALAIHVAHAIADQFPDGQLYVDLRGSKLRPKKPSAILARLLRSLGETEVLPSTLEELTSWYRSRTFGREFLFVLDNAEDEAQLRNILPASPTCAAIVTSQRRLSALSNTTFIDLHSLNLGDALSLLRRNVGEQRIASDPESAARIVSLCSHVPLALTIAAATLAARPHVSLREYSSRLAIERDRLNAFQRGDLDVRASLRVGYEDVQRSAPQDAHLFRLLGLLAANDFSPLFAAALIELPDDPEVFSMHAGSVLEGLERLVEMRLLERASLRRFRFHDLVRPFALECLVTDESPASRRSAEKNLWVWCATVASTVDDMFRPNERRRAAEQVLKALGKSGVDDPRQFEREQYFRILDSADVDRPELIAAQQHAYDAEEWDLALAIGSNLTSYLKLRGPVSELQQMLHRVLQSARSAGDAEQEALCLLDLAELDIRRGDTTDAVEKAQNALRIGRELTDRTLQGLALRQLGQIHDYQREWEIALGYYEEELRLFREMGERDGDFMAASNLRSALRDLGNGYHHTGRWDEALTSYQESMELDVSAGDWEDQARNALDIACVYRHLERWDQVLAYSQNAASISRTWADPYLEGLALYRAGEAHLFLGQPNEARKSLGQAMNRLPRTSYQFEELRDRLIALGWDDLLDMDSGPYVGEDNSDTEERDIERLSRIKTNIERHGWDGTYIVPDDESQLPVGWVYTTGLLESYRHPELVVFALRPEVAHNLMHRIVDQHLSKGESYHSGDRVDGLLDDCAVVFRSVPNDTEDWPLGTGWFYYDGGDFPVLQIVVPDMAGRFPWEAGCHPRVASTQEAIMQSPRSA